MDLQAKIDGVRDVALSVLSTPTARTGERPVLAACMPGFGPGQPRPIQAFRIVVDLRYPNHHDLFGRSPRGGGAQQQGRSAECGFSEESIAPPKSCYDRGYWKLVRRRQRRLRKEFGGALDALVREEHERWFLYKRYSDILRLAEITEACLGLERSFCDPLASVPAMCGVRVWLAGPGHGYAPVIEGYAPDNTAASRPTSAPRRKRSGIDQATKRAIKEEFQTRLRTPSPRSSEGSGASPQSSPVIDATAARKHGPDSAGPPTPTTKATTPTGRRLIIQPSKASSKVPLASEKEEAQGQVRSDGNDDGGANIRGGDEAPEKAPERSRSMDPDLDFAEFYSKNLKSRRPSSTTKLLAGALPAPQAPQASRVLRHKSSTASVDSVSTADSEATDVGELVKIWRKGAKPVLPHDGWSPEDEPQGTGGVFEDSGDLEPESGGSDLSEDMLIQAIVPENVGGGTLLALAELRASLQHFPPRLFFTSMPSGQALDARLGGLRAFLTALTDCARLGALDPALETLLHDFLEVDQHWAAGGSGLLRDFDSH
mmetsp:Transcript_35861/g.112589  ORF Transcript_35861/g.112589 Transcript_35861/m.112589 type:complete len:543 (-) Transcript_35861:221-1849(-)